MNKQQKDWEIPATESEMPEAMEVADVDFSQIPPGSEEEAAALLNVAPGRINRLNDRFVKYLFANEKHKPLLIDFINDVMLLEGEARVCDIEYIANELVQDAMDAKLSRLDLSVRTQAGNTVDVEIQVVNRHDFKKRAPYYWSLRHPRQLTAGMSYLELKPTIIICLLAFTMLLDEEPYRNGFSIRNDASGKRLCDDLQIVFLELPKYRREKIAEARTGLERWLSYFSNEGDDKMKNIADKDVSLAEALQLEKRFWANPKERERYFSEQKALMDALSFEKSIRIYAESEGLKRGMERGMAEGRAAGMAEGKLEGKLEEKLETARKMKAHGFSMDDVVELTGLSEEQVRALE